MKPVAIFRHAETEGPGHLAAFLDRQGIPWRLVAIDAGEAVPTQTQDFSGLVFMGGPMSVNDDLPWIPPVLALIRLAVENRVPVLGHCLGGQLMAKALGGKVTRTPVKEIGWGEVTAADTPAAADWLGDTTLFQAFHWHGETFSLPEGATRILSSQYCPNQAFVLGPHLAMQCHVEMTLDMIRTWCAVGADEIAQANSPAVQSPGEIQTRSPAWLPQLHKAAETLYSHWIKGLAR